MSCYSTIKTPKGKFRYHKQFLYVGIKKIDREIAFGNLKEIVPLLDGLGIKFGPIFGTLLGIIRENNFIEWDEDIDCYILKEQEDLFRSSLWDFQRAGFELVRYDKRGLFSLMKNGEYIDFYVLRSISPDVRHTGGADFLFEKYIQDTITYDFKGIPLSIPREYEEYLEFTYGDWRTPRKYADFNLGKGQILWLRIKNAVKNSLPDCIHSRLLKLHHTKDLKSFIQKCEAKGIPVDKNLKL